MKTMKLFIALTFGSILLIYAVFLKSFFPAKKNMPGFALHSDDTGLSSDDQLTFTLPHAGKVSHDVAVYKKVIIMLVDALRSDFVFDAKSPMSFVKYLRTEGKALSYVAKVHPPTVTLPRIKALTTGSIPGFVDVVLNFGSADLQEDNIISQMWHAGKKLVMYGDDTWLRLFPKHFVRSEGTTSFFVTDYTEVDDNVTRHLSSELENLDFDFLVLHYLGLDHIGHISGPMSPLIPPKLREMDDIVRQIYQALQKTEDDCLIVLCGDHGMSDQGGHGGASTSETRVPVVFISPSLHTDQDSKKIQEMEQIDLAPTLSLLQGLPIPKNNLGLVATDTLLHYAIDDTVMALRTNALQVLKVLKENSPDFNNEEGYIRFMSTSKKHADWLNHYVDRKDDADWLMKGKSIRKEYADAIVAMTKEISSSLTEYDMYGLIFSAITLWMILLTALLLFGRKVSKPAGGNSVNIFVCCFMSTLFCHVTVCTTQLSHSSLLCRNDLPSFLLQVIVLIIFSGYFTASLTHLFNIRDLKKIDVEITNKTWGSATRYLICGTILHSVSLLSSSFVEEEHQTWYFYTISVHFLILGHLLKIFLTQRFNGSETDLKVSQCYSTVEHVRDFTARNPEEISFFEKPKDPLIENCNTDSAEFSDIINEKKDLNCKGDNSEMTSKCGWRQLLAVIVVLVLCRLLRTWNQTGNKWLDVPDVGDWLVRPENKAVLSLLVIVSLAIVTSLKWGYQSWMERGLFITGTCFIYLFRVQTGGVMWLLDSGVVSKGTFPARVVYISVFLYMTLPLMHMIVGRILCRPSMFGPRSNHASARSLAVVFSHSIHTGWILLMMLLVRTFNVPMIVMVVTQQHVVERYVIPYTGMPVVLLTLYHLWMGMAAFFYQGNSNSISTVDVSAGYIGLEDYQPVIIGTLLTMSTYTGPIFWLISLVKTIILLNAEKYDTNLNCRNQLAQSLTQACHTLCVSRALPLAVYTVLVTLQRYHLFVWTVFSPKLLYEGMWTVVLSAFSISLLALVNLFH